MQNALNDKLSLSQWYATTTVSNITTLANLASVGTLTSGTWNASRIGIPYGGTGWSTIQAGTSFTATARTRSRPLSRYRGQRACASWRCPTWTATTTFGTGLTYAGGNVILNTSGDWSGTLNGYSASQLIGLGFRPPRRRTSSPTTKVSRSRRRPPTTTSPTVRAWRSRQRPRRTSWVRTSALRSRPPRELLRELLVDDPEDVLHQYV